MMRAGGCAAVLAGLALAGCGPGGEAPETPPAAAPKAAPAPAPAVGPSWTLETPAGGGAALVHADAAGREVLRVACRPGAPGLQAAAPGMVRIGSEDRLTLGAGTELAVFVVSMEGPEAGLRATGQPQPAFVEALGSGREVGVSYGARQLTLPAPPREAGAAFAARCAGRAEPASPAR